MEVNQNPQTIDRESGGAGNSAVRIERRGRYWAVFDGPTLVCLTVYKRGAREVSRRLNQQS